MEYNTISQYLLYCKIYKRLNYKTIKSYKIDIEQFYNSNYKDVIVYINNLSASNIKITTLKRKIASLKTFYAYLYENKFISYNPFYNHRFNFRKEKILPKIIPTEDLIKIYDYLSKEVLLSKSEFFKMKSVRNLLIISLLISTGLRISELCSISLEQIDIINRNINIMGKGKKERIIFIGDDNTYNLLVEYINNYHKKGQYFLFVGKNNNALTEQSIRLLLNIIENKLKLSKHITPHMFRHSFATMLLDNGVDIRYIQHILGHSSISVTQIYTHVSQNKQQEILSKSNPIKKLYNDEF